MEITINIRGLEGIATILERILSNVTVPQVDSNIVNPVQQMQVQAPIQQPQEPVQTQPMQAPTSQNQGVVPQQSIPQRNTYTQQQPYQAPAQNNVPQQQVPPNQAPTTAQSYDMNQLAVAATQLIDAGRLAEIQQLLGQFNVQALTALPKEQYGAFATALRGLGAKL